MGKRNRKPLRNWSDLSPIERARINWRCSQRHVMFHSAILLSNNIKPSKTNLSNINATVNICSFANLSRRMFGGPPKKLEPIHELLAARRNPGNQYTLVKNLSTLQAITTNEVDLNWRTINQLFRNVQENPLEALRSRVESYGYCYIFAASVIETADDYTLYELVIRGSRSGRTLAYGALVETFTKGFRQPTTLHKSIERVRREARQIRANLVAKRFSTSLFDFSKPADTKAMSK